MRPAAGRIDDYLDLNYKPVYRIEVYERTAIDAETREATYTYKETR